MKEISFKKLNYSLILLFAFIYTALIIYEYKKDMRQVQIFTTIPGISFVKKVPGIVSAVAANKENTSVAYGTID